MLQASSVSSSEATNAEEEPMAELKGDSDKLKADV